MDQIVITDNYLSDIREQFQKWAEFLNMSFGLLAFTLAITCLGTRMPAVNAWLSIAITILVRYKGRHLFPVEILKLRKAAKTDEKARVLLNGLEAEFFSWKVAVKDYPIFIVGYVLLAIVAFSPILTRYSTWLAAYIGA